MTLDPDPPPAAPSSAPAVSSQRTLIGWAAAGVVGVVLVLVAFLVVGRPDDVPTGPASGNPAAAPAAVDPVTGELVASTTFTVVDAAPTDPAPESTTDGLVVHPVRETPVYDGPGGRAVASMPTAQFGDTWLPVIAQRSGFVQVLLPSKPNGSTGWLRMVDLKDAHTPWLVRVHLRSTTLELLRNGRVVDTWKAGTGKASAPTPTGRTFVLGAFTDPKQRYSPIIFPLGAHSPTHDSFGGGPGTVAIHTWPTSDVFGTASSEGSVRIPQAALTKLTQVPLGTLVLITDD